MITDGLNGEPVDMECSDITNDQFGISGETVPRGGNLHIYYV